MRVQKPERNVHFPSLEQAVLSLWEQERTFQKSVDLRSDSKRFQFYDGPPFATGLPHFGHFVPSAIKDAFPRYFTMKGYKVERRFGWDCHGLPVEMLIQQELGLNGRADIEALGVARFNEACRQSVLRYTKQWQDYMRRLGRWVDMDNEYRTMDPDFMESVWAVVKKLWDEGLVYEGKFVVSYSTALGSSLSNFEASLNYKDVQDPSVTLKVPLKGNHQGRHLLVWTTTPWTLCANVAIAVDPNASYVALREHATQNCYVLLASRVGAYFSDSSRYTLESTFLGSALHDTPYEPIFNFFPSDSKNVFRVLGTDYVLHDVGTGAVHTAPAFGDDDFRCGQQYALPVIDHLDANGCFLTQLPDGLGGLYFKDADKVVLALLKKQSLVFKHETLVHSYPHCYRSETPLIYRAMPTWCVRVSAFKDRLLATNEQINWVPEHIKEGRFGRWLEGAQDWNISRNRYWGNPLPIWKNNETGEVLCLGSRQELESYAKRPLSDLHMEHIDDIEIPSPTGRGMLRRVPYVLDCWFESGSMPYAQQHYPFENKESFDTLFPADFICEGLDQTRGWFYTLHVLSTALFHKPAFKNVVVNGLVMAADGRKMSKKLKNYPDPMSTLNEFGADAMRIFLLNSPATVAEEVRFSEEGLKEAIRKVLLPLWNAYSFFATYASLSDYDPERCPLTPETELDLWILARLKQLRSLIDAEMMSFKIAKVCPHLIQFLDDLNNWYIRRSRRRFWDEDPAAFSVLFHVLHGVIQLLAPIAPFASEYVFRKLSLTQSLAASESVHLTLLPKNEDLTNEELCLLTHVETVRKIVELGRVIRVQNKLKVRQPLGVARVAIADIELAKAVRGLASLVADELNVKKVEVITEPGVLAKVILKPNFKTLGKLYGTMLPKIKKELEMATQEDALRVLKGQDFMVGDVTLSASDVLCELKASGKDLVAADGAVVVSLDPFLTPELKAEGLVREFVSAVQRLRKSGQFEVEERLQMGFSTPDFELGEAIAAHKGYIEDETLTLIREQLQTAAEGEKQSVHMHEEVSIEGYSVRVCLSRPGQTT